MHGYLPPCPEEAVDIADDLEMLLREALSPRASHEYDLAGLPGIMKTGQGPEIKRCIYCLPVYLKQVRRYSTVSLAYIYRERSSCIGPAELKTEGIKDVETVNR